MPFTAVQLKKNQDRRVRAGHCWIYSNEIDTDKTPIRELSPGQPVEVLNAQGKWLGYGYANPHSLICVRIVSRDRDHTVDVSLLVHRLKVALGLRQRLYPSPHYRLVFGEADGLPGLVVDRFGDVAVVQITTAGMESLKQEIADALDKVLRPQTIVFRNDVSVRELEGLDRYVESYGVPLGESLELTENGLPFRAPALEGQKTGWFYDQAFNRQKMVKYIQGKRVLDVCSYVGAWGVQAAAAGAEEVTCVDVSSRALEYVRENAGLNGVSSRVGTEQGDAFDVMRELRNRDQRFDVVMVDPPAFIKRKKDLKEGALAYRRINQLALQLCTRDGMLITSSCSHHMSTESLLHVTQQAARHTDRALQLLEHGEQSPDHPVHPAIPETAYLKAFYLRVLPAF